MADEKIKDGTHDSNPDPITGEPGAHPLGVAGGGSGGALAGAAIGAAVGGPVGALVGGAIGAVAGGYAGKGAAESVNPTEEDAHWRANHATQAFAQKDKPYEQYEPAYRHGWESASHPDNANRTFEQAEPDLERKWDSVRGTASTEWREVRDATRASYERIRNRTTNR